MAREQTVLGHRTRYSHGSKFSSRAPAGTRTIGALDKLEAFMSVNGAAFYQIPRNAGKVGARLAGTPHHACDGMSRSVYHPPNTNPAPRT